MAIWVAFPCVCATSLKQTIKSPVVAICIGAIFGPLAYQGAASIGSIELINGANGLGTTKCGLGHIAIYDSPMDATI